MASSQYTYNNDAYYCLRQVLLCIIVVLLQSIGVQTWADVLDVPIRTQSYRHTIGTARMQWTDEHMSRNAQMMPILEMSGDGTSMEGGYAEERTIVCSWDELSHGTHYYSYRLVHLDAQWRKDNLMESEYLRGFRTAEVIDYEHSINTQQLYTHYWFEFPTEDMAPKISGNYALLVYEDNDEDQIVASFCFSVVEPKVKLKKYVLSNTDIELNGRYQQLEIVAETGSLGIRSAQEEIKLAVYQNGRLDNMVYAPKATYIDGQTMRWQHCKQLIFEGGNEYRHFDLAGLYIKGAGVDEILYDKPTQTYRAFLYLDELRNYSPYLTEPDANGQWIIHAARTHDSNIEAEYMWVHWQLSSKQPILEGGLYIMGQAFAQEGSPLHFRMTYDSEHQCYTASAYLKQGAYEWQYAVQKKNNSQYTLLPTEGSHWQTDNDYTVYVYYRGLTDRYDRLVGVK